MHQLTGLSQDTLTRRPVFIDLETRSASDLPKVGGWNYAADRTTHLLTVAWSSEPEQYHVWYPWHPHVSDAYIAAVRTHLTTTHRGPEIPAALLAVTNREWAAHNAWNFDELVWRALMPDHAQPVGWIDTEPLARTIGLPGGLDAIGKRVWGEGKYEVMKHQLRKYMVAKRYGDAADIPVGIMPSLAEYNVQDVVLLAKLWDEITRWLQMPQDEWDVLTTHRGINHRGAPIDTDLLFALIDLTEEGRGEAVKRIAALTAGGKVELNTINDLQSRPTMFKWLDSIGITAFGTAAAGSLRKELIAQFIDTNAGAGDESEENAEDAGWQEEEGDADSVDAARDSVFLAVQVLQLRSAALRITGGKLSAAASAVCADGRLRGLFVYVGAHPWRWAGRRVQVQNLPRPKDGIGGMVWDAITAHEHRDRQKPHPLNYAGVDAMLPDRANPRYKYLTPDDASAALIRMLFTAGETADAPDWRTADDPVGVLAADLSNIEARVLAWFAGEKWLMDAFWKGYDPYIPMAEAIFGKRENWPGYDPKTVKKHAYRQVGKIVELGCGYSLGGNQMGIYAAANGIDLAANGTTGPKCVAAYRMTHPAIAGEFIDYYEDNEDKPYFRNGFWHKLTDRMMLAVNEPGVEVLVGVGGLVRAVMEGPHLMTYMPSGRRIVYRDAVVKRHLPKFLIGQFDKKGDQRYIDAVFYTHPRYGQVSMYGGKWAENIVQSASRDFLAHALVRVERVAALLGILHVHDEGVHIGRYSQKAAFMSAFTTLPWWADIADNPFPLDAEGGWLPRYSKSAPPGEKYKEEVWRNGSYLKPA